MNMRSSLLDHKCHTARPRLEPLEHRTAINAGLDDPQTLDVAGTAILCIRDRTAKHLLKELRTAIVNVLQAIQPFASGLATNEIRELPDLRRRNAGVTVNCSNMCHWWRFAVS